ncbi:MAG: transglutaminase domain-containing protein [Armatimonadetes bacterium]|nr:transglutaminase domain-containing protein [Armatimonadota bacterium]
MPALTPGEFQVLRHDVRSFVGDYTRMDYGDPTAPRMAQLREEFGLEAVVSGLDTEFEQFLALKRWVRSRWDHGWSHSFGKVKDALDILREAARGEQFFCEHFAITLSQCATALGWPARMVAINIAECGSPRDYHAGNTGHGVVEIWSNEHGKWVVMDADMNVHYERDGVPLHALEIRDAWLSGEADRVRMVQDEPAFVFPAGRTVEIWRENHGGGAQWNEGKARTVLETFARHRALDYYARVRVNGWLWVDQRCLPTLIRNSAPWSVRTTSNPADMYWTVNAVRMSLKPGWDEKGGCLTVTLEHCTPFFSHYEARTDRGEWRRGEATLAWPMREGVNTLECRAVNVMGRRGVTSSLDVAYASPQ